MSQPGSSHITVSRPFRSLRFLLLKWVNSPPFCPHGVEVLLKESILSVKKAFLTGGKKYHPVLITSQSRNWDLTLTIINWVPVHSDPQNSPKIGEGARHPGLEGTDPQRWSDFPGTCGERCSPHSAPACPSWNHNAFSAPAWLCFLYLTPAFHSEGGKEGFEEAIFALQTSLRKTMVEIL